MEIDAGRLMIAVLTFLLSLLAAFFWHSKANQTKRMDSVESKVDDAHRRITEQADNNNEKFARRDDVRSIESRLVKHMDQKFTDLKEDIRSLRSES